MEKKAEKIKENKQCALCDKAVHFSDSSGAGL